MNRRDRKEKRREKNWYGMKKLRKGQKVAWLAQENKHGWALGLAMGKRTLWLRNLRFATREDVAFAMENTGLVFIHLKDSKTIPETSEKVSE